MKKIVLLVLIVNVIFGCKKSQKFYYPEGNLHVEYFTDKDGGIIGTHKEYFKSGKLKVLQKYNKNNIAYKIEGYYDTEELKFEQIKTLELDSFVGYHKNGKFESKGMIKNGNRFGWWDFYNSEGQLTSKIKYRFINDTLRKNQIKSFIEGNKLDFNNSFFYKDNIPDKTKVDSRIDVSLEYYSKYSDSSLLYFCYSKDINGDFSNLSKVKLDTLYPIKNEEKRKFKINFAFSKVDTVNFKGFFVEKINLYEEIDSSKVKVKKYSNTVYFDKKIIIEGDSGNDTDY